MHVSDFDSLEFGNVINIYNVDIKGLEFDDYYFDDLKPTAEMDQN